ncbi:class I SAM-dependent methyltransferase [Macrococcus equipercicus]|uniref:Class I SAM-dependent methyltransferase n=1 Tax=Macrococcus equipercicus TaxID=69967 RepID=A0A9Q9BTM1_9STAP|nr:class I SAM-dependent methyltransferase [Macrococcus equipercicus]KAA1037625.1 class I SAM-dependent methyltransferase [Macrococcus equipercicus]UTH14139.1 class I SAM-dependent methyltransferase [Macrococcus equipercicus]
MDNTELFTNKAEIYELGRPSYPDALLAFMKDRFIITEQTVIADIGAGTGKFTEKLLDLGCHVIAIEPNQAMANELRDGLMCGQLSISERPAEHTELDDNSVDMITAAQSFHWFEVHHFKKECQRILAGNGPVCLIWNSRIEEAPINKKTHAVFKQHCPDFKGFSGGEDSGEGVISDFFEGDFELFEFDYPLDYTLKKFVGRCVSASYSLEPSHENYPAFEQALTKMFHEFAEDGKVKVPNVTRCYYGYI